MFEPCPLHPLRPGLVLPGPLHPEGVVGPTRTQAQSRHVRRTSWGYYLPASVVDDDPQQRIAEASVLVPPGHAITGWAALCWRGGRWFEGLTATGERRPITIAIGTHDIRAQPGIAVSGEGLKARMVEWVDGVPVTDARYAVSFEMRYARSVRQAVVELEKALYSDLVSIEEQTAFMTPGQNGWTGIPKGREALGLAQENSWSPREGPMRLIWEIDAGHPRPLCNAPVFDLRGHHIGTPDLIDPVSGVAGEYEGDVHLDRGQRHHDLRRDGVFRAHDIEPVTMSAPDVLDPSAFIGRLHDAYRRAESRPASSRTWTLEQPEWWVPTQTVAQRRALTAEQRERYLAYRVA